MSAAAQTHGRFRRALELSALDDGMTVVDWGTAHGWLATIVAQHYPSARVLACDIPYPHGAPDFRGHEVQYIVVDEAAPRLPLEDGTVDRVFLLEVLEHMGSESRAAALAEMRRVLKPDGVVVVTVPHRWLLHWTDVENIRFRFPRLHRLVFEFVRGRAAYKERYGENPLVNFSSDAVEHHHFDEAELARVLSSAGFVTTERRLFGLLYMGPWALDLILEAVRRARPRGLPALERANSRLTLLSFDALPPRMFAETIGVSARRVT